MSTQQPAAEKVIFSNLIEVSGSETNYGTVVTVASPFSSGNAAGAICDMNLDAIAARAESFGSRFKLAMTN